MAQTAFIIDVTQETFSSLVIDKSAKIPVLVDFWASWCAPCQMLMPILTKLAEEYQGQFVVAKVNSDEQRDLAAQYGVRSLPTLKLFRHGEAVDEMIGAQPESVIRATIERYIVRESDRMTDAALESYRQGHVDQAVEALQRAAAQDPDNGRATLELAKILVEQAQLDGADVVLNDLPRALQEKPEVRALRARLKFARIAQEAPDQVTLTAAIEKDPNDNQARYLLSSLLVQRAEYEPALAQLLEIIRRDRKYGDDAGRKAMLELLELIEGQDELVSRYRNRMFAVLH